MHSNNTQTVWADVSTWQRVVDDSYPEPMLAFRADTGWSTDGNAAANWAWCRRTARLKVAVAYVVLIPGHESAIVARLKGLFGSAPPAKLAVMIDMESGSGFAGGGNHSASGNRLAGLLAAWLGDRRRVLAYANGGDYRSCWPQLASWLAPRRITASYGSVNPGTWGHQYYGGMPYPTPAGLPRSIAPFGGNVDLNVTHRSVAQVAADLGLASAPTSTPTPSIKETGMAVVIRVDQKECAKKRVRWPGDFVDIGDMHPRHIATKAELDVRVHKQRLPWVTVSIAEFKAVGGH